MARVWRAARSRPAAAGQDGRRLWRSSPPAGPERPIARRRRLGPVSRVSPACSGRAASRGQEGGSVRWRWGARRRDRYSPWTSAPRVPHEGFRSLLELETWSPARGVIEPMMRWYEDVDGNFVEQFQSTGFDARCGSYISSRPSSKRVTLWTGAVRFPTSPARRSTTSFAWRRRPSGRRGTSRATWFLHHRGTDQNSSMF